VKKCLDSLLYLEMQRRKEGNPPYILRRSLGILRTLLPSEDTAEERTITVLYLRMQCRNSVNLPCSALGYAAIPGRSRSRLAPLKKKYKPAI
jgi:hypothetical protein